MSWTIRYWRDAQWAKRFQQAGIANKPEGFVTSPYIYHKKIDAQRTADACNAQPHEYPCEVVAIRRTGPVPSPHERPITNGQIPVYDDRSGRFKWEAS